MRVCAECMQLRSDTTTVGAVRRFNTLQLGVAAKPGRQNCSSMEEPTL